MSTSIPGAMLPASLEYKSVPVATRPASHRVDLVDLDVPMEFKTAILTLPSSQLAEAANVVLTPGRVSEGAHEVTAVIAVTGVRDEVGDIIVPGAFANTLRERPKPKVCLGHDWNRPIGKTKTISELRPGDPGLPPTTYDGKPWPREAGAVIARYVPDMTTEDGRNAYNSAKFFGPEESTFSFGYKTRKAEHRDGTRYLHDVAVYEYGPVLNPANRLATLQDIKSEQVDGLEVKAKQVRDVAYWGEPYGTPITEHMHPHGPKARAERRAGRVPSRAVGVMESSHRPAAPPKISAADRAAEIAHTGLFPEPASDLRAVPGPRATGADQQHIDALAGHIRDGMAEPDAEDEDRAAIDKAVRGLLNEAITPTEVHDRLAAHPEITAGADSHNDAVDRVGRDYAARYAALAAEQQRMRAQAGTPIPPERFAGMTNTQLRGHENASQQILADLLGSGVGHEEPPAQLASANIQGAQHEMALRAQTARAHPAVGKAHAQGVALWQRNPEQAATRADQMQPVLDELNRQQALKPPPQGSRAERMPHQIQAMIRGLRGVSADSKETPLPGKTSRAESATVGAMPEAPAKPARRTLRDFSDAELAAEKDKATRTAFTRSQSREGDQARARIRTIQAIQDDRADAARRNVPAHPLAPDDYRKAQDHALNMRFRQRDMRDENDRIEQHNSRIASSEQTAASAPATIDHAPEGTEVVGGRRLLLANGGGNSWSLRSADNKHLVGADDFATPKGGKAKLSRTKINDLANHMADIRNSNGDRAPFTAPRAEDWAQGFRDEHGNDLSGATALAVRDWTGRNNLAVRDHSRFSRDVRPVGGRQVRTDRADAAGFYPHQRVGQVRAGDEVRLPEGDIKTVQRTDTDIPSHDENGKYLESRDRPTITTLHFTDGTDHTITDRALGGRRVDVRYANGASPMDESMTHDPGMGFTSASNLGSRPGSNPNPSAQQFDRKAETALRNTPGPGTRFVEPRDGARDYKDERPRVGTITDRTTSIQGTPARVVEYDDGTFDAITPAGLAKVNASPSDDEVNEARAAWGLPRTGTAKEADALPGTAPTRLATIAEAATPPPKAPDVGAPAETHANALARMTDQQAREHVGTLPHSKLSEIDQIMSSRATALGKPGVVTGKHQMVRDAIPAAHGSAVVTGPMQDEMANARSEVLGLHEMPDGHLEVEPEVGARQDRVAKLLTQHEAGALDLKGASTEDLHQHHRDLSNELRLQQEIARRDAVHPPTRVAAATTQAGTPRVRPGLAGAAQDHAEALRSEDAAAINRTRARLESALRRSRAGSDTATTLAQHVQDGHANAATLDALAGSLRAESRDRRNVAARKRTAAKRLDRDRISSVLGSVNAELRSRGESPEVAKELGAPRTTNAPEPPLMSEGPVLRTVVGGPAATRQAVSEAPKAEPVKPLTDTEYEKHTQQVEQRIDAALKAGKATNVTHTINGEGKVYTPARAALHKQIVDEIWNANGEHAPREGRSVLAGGLMGAGKSTVPGKHAGIAKGDYFTINPDEIKDAMATRGMVPEVKGLSPLEASTLIHDESSHISNMLAQRAYSHHTNVIWDVSMSNKASMQRRINEMAGHGYSKPDGVFVNVPVETSVERALSRHRKGMEAYRQGQGMGGRYAPPHLIRQSASTTSDSANRDVFNELDKEKAFGSSVVYDNSTLGQAPRKITGTGRWADSTSRAESATLTDVRKTEKAALTPNPAWKQPHEASKTLTDEQRTDLFDLSHSARGVYAKQRAAGHEHADALTLARGQSLTDASVPRARVSERASLEEQAVAATHNGRVPMFGAELSRDASTARTQHGLAKRTPNASNAAYEAKVTATARRMHALEGLANLRNPNAGTADLTDNAKLMSPARLRAQIIALEGSVNPMDVRRLKTLRKAADDRGIQTA